MPEPRFSPIITAEGLSTDQQQAFAAVVASRGAVVGPFTVLLHQPELAAAAEAMGGYLRFRSGLDATVREAVIITVAELLGCQFEAQAHEPLARAAGIDVAALRAGRTAGLGEHAQVAVELARRLITEHRVPDELFERARALLAEPAVLDLVALVGYYAFLAAILNGYEVSPTHLT